MEARPNEPNTPGRNREEGRSSQVPTSKGVILVRGQQFGAGLEEEWTFLGTDDPAFWLKEPGRDRGW